MTGKLKVLLKPRHDPGSHEIVILYPHRALIAPRVRVDIAHLLEALSSNATLHVPLDALAQHAGTITATRATTQHPDLCLLHFIE